MSIPHKELLQRLLIGLASTAVIAGAWWAYQPQKNQIPTATALVVNANAVFEVSSCLTRLHEDKPALGLMFTLGVAADQPLEKLVEVMDLGETNPAKKPSENAVNTPIQGTWIGSDNPHVLVFPYVKAGHKYQIKVSQALHAVTGKTLAQPHSCEVLSDEMSPSYFFASKGTVLPAGLNGGLPVVTINIPEIDVEFLRVAPEKLPAFIDMVLGKRQSNTTQDGVLPPTEN